MPICHPNPRRQEKPPTISDVTLVLLREGPATGQRELPNPTWPGFRIPLKKQFLSRKVRYSELPTLDKHWKRAKPINFI